MDFSKDLRPIVHGWYDYPTVESVALTTETTKPAEMLGDVGVFTDNIYIMLISAEATKVLLESLDDATHLILAEDIFPAFHLAVDTKTMMGSHDFLMVIKESKKV